jgi:hypothetical protein
MSGTSAVDAPESGSELADIAPVAEVASVAHGLHPRVQPAARRPHPADPHGDLDHATATGTAASRLDTLA